MAVVDRKPDLVPLTRNAPRWVAWAFVAVLAWAPFPLGGAVSWGAGLQEVMIALCWVLVAATTGGFAVVTWEKQKPILVPAVLVILVLAWIGLQTVPFVPPSWPHPLWQTTSEVLHQQIPPVISLNPWRTESELLKLLAAVGAFWISFVIAQRAEGAKLLLNAVIAIGVGYAVYAIALSIAATNQASVFYSVPQQSLFLSGPFMSHNSFAAYLGLVSIAVAAKLFALGSETVETRSGIRLFFVTLIQFCFGRGAVLMVAAVVTFSGVVASASRAGFAATVCGLLALAAASAVAKRDRAAGKWAGVGVLLAVLPVFVLILLSGGMLQQRFDQLIDGDKVDAARLALWSAAGRMIQDAPWLGLGLGTFQDAYPLYAAQVLPFVMDKAHCDYLEFAAGVGLPAAAAWWAAILWLAGVCLWGIRRRRRNRLYPAIAVGATVLIGVHSTVDFSLQMPAIALLYACMLGIGVAQARSTRREAGR